MRFIAERDKFEQCGDTLLPGFAIMHALEDADVVEKLVGAQVGVEA